MFDAGLVSLGLSLGTAGTDADNSSVVRSSKKESDDKFIETPYYQYTHRYPRMSNKQYVKPSTSAVVVNYFLKTHGGTHVMQCLLSLLASVLGLTCLLLPSFPTTVGDMIDINSLARRTALASAKYSLLQQTLLVAVAKHASGLIGALLLGASKIPQIGLRDTRKHLEVVTSDPVGQYLFYCSLLVVWLNLGAAHNIASLKTQVTSLRNAATVDSKEGVMKVLDGFSHNPPPWYLKQSTGGFITPIIMLLPILLREIISIAWVVSDVLTLAFTSSGGMTGKFMHSLLILARSIIDAAMSIVVTSEKWRRADSFTRQRTLARLVSRCSLGMEIIVGGILIGDAIQLFWRFAFVLNVAEDFVIKPSFRVVLGKIICAHLYLNFLLSRRKSIEVLIGSIRGGAFFDRVLDVLIDPEREMGLIGEEEDVVED